MTSTNNDGPKVEKGLTCPACDEPELTLTQVFRDIPHFGRTHIHASQCQACGYESTDVEAKEDKDPVRVTYTVEQASDLNTRVVRSSTGEIILDGLGSIEPNNDARGFVSNIEGVLDRFEERLRVLLSEDLDDEEEDQAREHLDRIESIRRGNEDLVVAIEDHRGQSDIISDDAEREPLQERE